MKIFTFIGAGSFKFTRSLVKDILAFPTLADSEIRLMDVDEERLSYITRYVERIVKEGRYPAKVVSTTDRAKALQGADGVVCTIFNGGVDVWRYDVEIPKQYGVDINVGDTRGPSGIFRFLRNLPVMLDICRDIEKYCPEAIFLNYTNPMSMLCRAMLSETKVNVTGLCHSVQGTVELLSRWIGVPKEEISYTCAGINHMSWYLDFLWNGKDAYPLLDKALEQEDIYKQEIVRNQMYRHLGYYPTESSGHHSEYNPWFRKRPELIEKYCVPCTGWNPGVYAFSLNNYLRFAEEWRADWSKEMNAPEIDLSRGHEYAAYIFNAIHGDHTPFTFNGNMLNHGVITNLPFDACIETPVLVDRSGYHREFIGDLPLSVLPLTSLSCICEEMAVEGALTGNRELIYRAIYHDPLTSAVLSLDEIQEMVTAMFEKNQAYLDM